MGRPPRIQFEGAAYHVFSRGNRRERIFRTEEDYAAFEDILLEAMRWSGVQLFNWNQMPNHFHFNIETPDGNLAEFMQRLLTRFAKYFNRTHRLVGHLFQGRYGARLVDQEAHFKEIVRYVELNSYRLKKGKLTELGAWKWSSLRHYLLPENQWPEGCRIAFRRVLERFGNEPVTARKNLATFLADGLASGTWEDFYQVKNQRFIGEEAFVERMKHGNQESVRSEQRNVLPHLEMSDLLSVTQKLSGLTQAELAAPTKMRIASSWRKALIYVARRLYRVPIVEIAPVLGRDATTISHTLERTRDKQSPEIIRLTQGLQPFNLEIRSNGK